MPRSSGSRCVVCADSGSAQKSSGFHLDDEPSLWTACRPRIVRDVVALLRREVVQQRFRAEGDDGLGFARRPHGVACRAQEAVGEPVCVAATDRAGFGGEIRSRDQHPSLQALQRPAVEPAVMPPIPHQVGEYESGSVGQLLRNKLPDSAAKSTSPLPAPHPFVAQDAPAASPVELLDDGEALGQACHDQSLRNVGGDMIVDGSGRRRLGLLLRSGRAGQFRTGRTDGVIVRDVSAATGPGRRDGTA